MAEVREGSYHRRPESRLVSYSVTIRTHTLRRRDMPRMPTEENEQSLKGKSCSDFVGERAVCIAHRFEDSYASAHGSSGAVCSLETSRKTCCLSSL